MMRYWRKLLGGLLLWATHFLAVYAIGSIMPGTRDAVILVLLATGLALAAAFWLFATTITALRAASDDFQRWSAGLTLLGYALAGTAITFQGLPAALS